jgi:hypothetical protein
MNLLLTFSIFFYPFHVISLISWYKISRIIIYYVNILFRMIPSFLLLTLFFSINIITYSMVKKKIQIK